MSDMTAVSQWRKRFIEQHGGMKAAVPINDGDWLLFPDGALIENETYGTTQEPPDDPLKRVQLKVRYHEIRVQRSERAFHDLKSQIKATFSEGRTDYAGFLYEGDQSEALADLKLQQDAVKRCRRELLAVRKELEALSKPQALDREEVEADRIIDKRNRHFAERLREMKV